MPTVHVGDLTDVVILGDRYEPGARPRVLGSPSVVIAVAEGTITLGVPLVEVADVAAANAEGRVALAMR